MDGAQGLGKRAERGVGKDKIEKRESKEAEEDKEDLEDV